MNRENLSSKERIFLGLSSLNPCVCNGTEMNSVLAWELTDSPPWLGLRFLQRKEKKKVEKKVTLGLLELKKKSAN